MSNQANLEVERLIDALVERRKALGWSVRLLARAAGVQPSTVLRIESGERRPSLLMYTKLRLALEAA